MQNLAEVPKVKDEIAETRARIIATLEAVKIPFNPDIASLGEDFVVFVPVTPEFEEKKLPKLGISPKEFGSIYIKILVGLNEIATDHLTTFLQTGKWTDKREANSSGYYLAQQFLRDVLRRQHGTDSLTPQDSRPELLLGLVEEMMRPIEQDETTTSLHQLLQSAQIPKQTDSFVIESASPLERYIISYTLRRLKKRAKIRTVLSNAIDSLGIKSSVKGGTFSPQTGEVKVFGKDSSQRTRKTMLLRATIAGALTGMALRYSGLAGFSAYLGSLYFIANDLYFPWQLQRHQKQIITHEVFISSQRL